MTSKSGSSSKSGSPRAMPVETIITRYKSAQLKNEKVTKTEAPVQQRVKSLPQKPKKGKPKTPIEDVIEIPDDTEPTEYYPEKTKRETVLNKVQLKPKHELTVIAQTNKRKRSIPQRGTSLVSNTDRPLDPRDPEDQSLPKRLKHLVRAVDVDVGAMIQEMEAEAELDEDDLLEILTCPSPVWWEEHPDEHIEEALCSRRRSSTDTCPSVRSQLNDLKRSTTPNVLSRSISDLKPVNNVPDSNVGTDSDVDIRLSLGTFDKKFIEKRSKLENVLGALKGKHESDKVKVVAIDNDSSSDNNVNNDNVNVNVGNAIVRGSDAIENNSSSDIVNISSDTAVDDVKSKVSVIKNVTSDKNDLVSVKSGDKDTGLVYEIIETDSDEENDDANALDHAQLYDLENINIPIQSNPTPEKQSSNDTRDLSVVTNYKDADDLRGSDESESSEIFFFKGPVWYDCEKEQGENTYVMIAEVDDDKRNTSVDHFKIFRKAKLFKLNKNTDDSDKRCQDKISGKSSEKSDRETIEKNRAIKNFKSFNDNSAGGNYDDTQNANSVQTIKTGVRSLQMNSEKSGNIYERPEPDKHIEDLQINSFKIESQKDRKIIQPGPSYGKTIADNYKENKVSNLTETNKNDIQIKVVNDNKKVKSVEPTPDDNKKEDYNNFQKNTQSQRSYKEISEENTNNFQKMGLGNYNIIATTDSQHAVALQGIDGENEIDFEAVVNEEIPDNYDYVGTQDENCVSPSDYFLDAQENGSFNELELENGYEGIQADIDGQIEAEGAFDEFEINNTTQPQIITNHDREVNFKVGVIVERKKNVNEIRNSDQIGNSPIETVNFPKTHFDMEKVTEIDDPSTVQTEVNGISIANDVLDQIDNFPVEADNFLETQVDSVEIQSERTQKNAIIVNNLSTEQNLTNIRYQVPQHPNIIAVTAPQDGQNCINGKRFNNIAVIDSLTGEAGFEESSTDFSYQDPRTPNNYANTDSKLILSRDDIRLQGIQVTNNYEMQGKNELGQKKISNFVENEDFYDTGQANNLQYEEITTASVGVIQNKNNFNPFARNYDMPASEMGRSDDLIRSDENLDEQVSPNLSSNPNVCVYEDISASSFNDAIETNQMHLTNTKQVQVINSTAVTNPFHGIGKHDEVSALIVENGRTNIEEIEISKTGIIFGEIEADATDGDVQGVTNFQEGAGDVTYEGLSISEYEDFEVTNFEEIPASFVEVHTTQNIDDLLSAANFVEVQTEDFNEIQSPIKSNDTQSPMKSNEIQSPIKSNDIQSPIKSNEIQSPIKSNEIQSPIKSNETQSPIKLKEIQLPIKSPNCDEIQAPRNSVDIQTIESLNELEISDTFKEMEVQTEINDTHSIAKSIASVQISNNFGHKYASQINTKIAENQEPLTLITFEDTKKNNTSETNQSEDNIVFGNTEINRLVRDYKNSKRKHANQINTNCAEKQEPIYFDNTQEIINKFETQQTFKNIQKNYNFQAINTGSDSIININNIKASATDISDKDKTEIPTSSGNEKVANIENSTKQSSIKDAQSNQKAEALSKDNSKQKTYYKYNKNLALTSMMAQKDTEANKNTFSTTKTNKIETEYGNKICSICKRVLRGKNVTQPGSELFGKAPAYTEGFLSMTMKVPGSSEDSVKCESCKAQTNVKRKPKTENNNVSSSVLKFRNPDENSISVLKIETPLKNKSNHRNKLPPSIRIPGFENSSNYPRSNGRTMIHKSDLTIDGPVSSNNQKGTGDHTVNNNEAKTNFRRPNNVGFRFNGNNNKNKDAHLFNINDSGAYDTRHAQGNDFSQNIQQGNEIEFSQFDYSDEVEVQSLTITKVNKKYNTKETAKQSVKNNQRNNNKSNIEKSKNHEEEVFLKTYNLVPVPKRNAAPATRVEPGEPKPEKNVEYVTVYQIVPEDTVSDCRTECKRIDNVPNNSLNTENKTKERNPPVKSNSNVEWKPQSTTKPRPDRNTIDRYFKEVKQIYDREKKIAEKAALLDKNIKRPYKRRDTTYLYRNELQTNSVNDSALNVHANNERQNTHSITFTDTTRNADENTIEEAPVVVLTKCPMNYTHPIVPENPRMRTQSDEILYTIGNDNNDFDEETQVEEPNNNEMHPNGTKDTEEKKTSKHKKDTGKRRKSSTSSLNASELTTSDSDDSRSDNNSDEEETDKYTLQNLSTADKIKLLLIKQKNEENKLKRSNSNHESDNHEKKKLRYKSTN